MKVRAILSNEVEAARHLLLSAGWDRKISNAEEFAKLVSRSQLALVAVTDGQVVGFIRALTDGMTNGYISMVVVAEELRGTGIGRALVQAVWGPTSALHGCCAQEGQAFLAFMRSLVSKSLT
jgi:ribosomal protein S18 acetylase RimI-like enzyme